MFSNNRRKEDNMNKLMAYLALSISTGLFSGFLGRGGSGGGLAGSIFALLIQVVLIYFNADWTIDACLVLVALLLGLITVRSAEAYLLKKTGKRRRHTGEYANGDFNETNIDEIVGQFIAGFGAFVIKASLSVKLLALLISFIAFRYFDTKKPLGIWRVEDLLKNRYPSFSIMMDDILGGSYAMIVGLLTGIVLRI